MIREKIDGHREKQLITYSITSTEFLKQIHSLCKPELFKTPYAKQVYSWCASYFQEYNRAPGKDISDLYAIHKESLEEDDVDLVRQFLSNLSDSYEEAPQNLDYLVQQSLDYLRIRSVEVLQEELKICVTNKDYLSAEAAIASFSRIEQYKSTAVDALTDDDAIVSAFSDDSETLFTLPGAVGEICGDFKRGDFMAALAYAKRGKSQMLWYLAQHAMEAGCKVLFITLEMPVPQMLRRIWMSFMARPKYTKTVKIPFFYKDNESDERWRVDHVEETREGFIPEKETIMAWRDCYRKYFRGGDIKLVSMPARSVTVADVRNYVDNMEYFQNWMPDVIVLDYADLLASKMKGEVRHQLDDIWANLRRYALEKNICICSASQSGRASANADASDENIAEDIRKVAHVTKMIAINGSKEERANGLLRLASIAERDDAAIFDQVVITNSFDIGRFALDSRWKKDVYLEKAVRGKEE